MTRLGDCRRTAVAAVSSVAVVALMGCGQILGADEYGMADAPPVSACASPDAPVGPGGTCTAVGVIDCAKGRFLSDDQGGCNPILPLETPCPSGNLAFPGANACSALQTCFSRYFGLGQTATGAARWYVDQAAPAGGDGTTPDTPFNTIMAAVGAAGLTPATILIAPGEYRETIEVAAPLLLLGACPGGTGGPTTTLRAPDDTSGPVVKFSPTADATTEFPTSAGIGMVEIVGGTAGVAAKGNLALGMGALWVHDVAGPGISLADGVTATSRVHIQGDAASGGGRLLIESSTGAGIALDGATLDASTGSIAVRRTRPLANGQGGYGIALHPSRDLALVLDTLTTPSRLVSAQSSITLDSAVLEENAGAGLFVEGSTAVVTRSVIRNTHANGLGEGRGVVVQQRALGPISASLNLRQSVVEASADVGVLVVDSPGRLDGTAGVTAHIENTTIRGVAGVASAPEGTPCLGNGLRVRADGAPSDTAQIVLKNSLIEGAHEAGVQVQAARVDVLDSIVRGTAACASDFGDGIDVLGDAVAHARVTVTGSRIEASARAGVASFGAEVVVASSVIDGGGATPVVAVERGGVSAKVSVLSSVCTAGSARTSCDAEKETLAPSLVGGNGCDAFANEGVCFRFCNESVYARLTAPNADPSQAVRSIQGVVMWAPDELQIAASFTGRDGCVEWGGLPRNETQVWANAVDGYLPTTWWQTTGREDSISARSGLVGNDVAWGISGIVHQTYDPRMAPLAVAVVCKPPDPSGKSKPRELCVGRGAAGLTLRAESLGAAGPFYVAATGIPLPAEPGQSITSASYGQFVNAPPGDFVVRILPPANAGSVRCTADAFDTGWTMGELQGGDTLKMPARPGFIAIAFAYCTVE